MPTLTEAGLERDYGEALRLCADDAREHAGAVRVLRIDRHHKSAQVYVIAGPGDEPSHVIKLEPGEWSPEREFQGLEYVKRVVVSAPPVDSLRLAAITPVGFGCTPQFLVTRYQPGASIRPAFDRATASLLPHARSLEQAKVYARAIARWLLLFRSGEAKEGQGYAPEEFARFCSDRADEIERLLGDRTCRNVLEPIERHLGQLDVAELAEMRTARPVHGDLAPQNFHLDDAGVIYSLDLESFHHHAINADLASFRMRLEHYALRGPLARARSAEIWRAFWDAYAPDESARLLLLSYVHKLLAHLAWVRDPRYLSRQAAVGTVRSRLKTGLWIRGRLRWLAGLSGDVIADSRHARCEI